MATIKKACKGVTYPKASSVSRKLKAGGSLGMKSVKAGYDKNPGVTRADVIVAAKGKAKKGMKIKKAQTGYNGSTRMKKQMDANTNPTFNPSFTDKKGVTRTYETDTTGLAAGKERFPYKKTISGTSPLAQKLQKRYSNPYYGSVDRKSVNKALETQGGKQKNGGKTSKKK